MNISKYLQEQLTDQLFQLQKELQSNRNLFKTEDELTKELDKKIEEYEKKIEDLESKYPNLCYEDLQDKQEIYDLEQIVEQCNKQDYQNLKVYCSNHQDELQSLANKLEEDVNKKKEQKNKLEKEKSNVDEVNVNLKTYLEQQRQKFPKAVLIQVIQGNDLIDEQSDHNEIDFLKQAINQLNDYLSRNTFLQSICATNIKAMQKQGKKYFVSSDVKQNPQETLYNDIFIVYRECYKMNQSTKPLDDESLSKVFAQTLILLVKKLYNTPLEQPVRQKNDALRLRFKKVMNHQIIQKIGIKVMEQCNVDTEDDINNRDDEEDEDVIDKQQEFKQQLAFLYAFAITCGRQISYDNGSNPPRLVIDQK